jgi:hypothetical protein
MLTVDLRDAAPPVHALRVPTRRQAPMLRYSCPAAVRSGTET